MKVEGRAAEPEAEGYRRLLALLDTDPRRADGAYERLRARLVQLFVWRGVRFPEELADETLTRVARRLGEGLEIEAKDPFRFCCGVAFRVQKEALRQEERQRKIATEGAWATVVPAVTAPSEDDEEVVCLQRCLATLKAKSRTLILRYYEGERSKGIARRRRLAEELGIPQGALRNRAQRLRSKLEACVTDCVRGRDVSAAERTPRQRRVFS